VALVLEAWEPGVYIKECGNLAYALRIVGTWRFFKEFWMGRLD
jgi:hypothetical protein